MIEIEETIVQLVTKTFTTPAPDTSNIVAEVADGIATITYGGSALIISTDALAALGALVTSIVIAFPAPAPAPAPAPTPAPTPTPAP